MAKPPKPMQMAQRKCRDVRQTLLAQKLFIFPQPTQRAGEIPVWEAHFEGPYPVGVLAGEWTLHGRWRYWSDPRSGEGVLQESSVGVTVIDHSHPALPESVCVARYDVELHGGFRGRHLNVYQPVVRDKVHWAFVDVSSRFDDWSFELVLAFLLKELPDELLNAGWPTA